MTRRWWFAVLLVLALVAASCGGDDGGGGDGDAGPETTASAEDGGGAGADTEGDATDDGEADDDAPTDEEPFEWSEEDPADHGIDPAGLDEAFDYAAEEGRNTQGVVVVHDGAIVGEWYAEDADEESWAASWSMAKSYTSALIGIAIEEGLIDSVDEPMTTWYPEWEDTDRGDITLRDVLQMSSGLDYTENYSPDAFDESDIIQMVLFQEDQLAYAADRPALHEPGTEWNYSSGDTMILSGLLEQVTGMPTADYAEEQLFEPLGIDQVDWWSDAEGHTLTYCCLDTTSRNYARFGQLYLQDGEWEGEQLVPAESWAGYGYQWWRTGAESDDLPDDLFAARGHDGQYTYVIPSLDLVVVRNGTYIKHDGEAVADPNLFDKYPSGVNPERGTVAPDSEVGWDDAEFLAPILEAVDA
jgi:CubicO group peptidase (beta-lactamase class C family)